MKNVLNVLKSKRFVVRKSLIGKGDEITYNHDKVFEIMKETLTKLPCWEKYKSYTATNNIPTICRGKELVQPKVESKTTLCEVLSSTQ